MMLWGCWISDLGWMGLAGTGEGEDSGLDVFLGDHASEKERRHCTQKLYE